MNKVIDTYKKSQSIINAPKNHCLCMNSDWISFYKQLNMLMNKKLLKYNKFALKRPITSKSSHFIQRNYKYIQKDYRLCFNNKTIYNFHLLFHAASTEEDLNYYYTKCF